MLRSSTSVSYRWHTVHTYLPRARSPNVVQNTTHRQAHNKLNVVVSGGIPATRLYRLKSLTNRLKMDRKEIIETNGNEYISVSCVALASKISFVLDFRSVSVFIFDLSYFADCLSFSSAPPLDIFHDACVCVCVCVCQDVLERMDLRQHFPFSYNFFSWFTVSSLCPLWHFSSTHSPSFCISSAGSILSITLWNIIVSH